MMYFVCVEILLILQTKKYKNSISPLILYRLDIYMLILSIHALAFDIIAKSSFKDYYWMHEYYMQVFFFN